MSSIYSSQFETKLLRFQCACNVVYIDRCAVIPRADYELMMHEFNFHIRLRRKTE